MGPKFAGLRLLFSQQLWKLKVFYHKDPDCARTLCPLPTPKFSYFGLSLV